MVQFVRSDLQFILDQILFSESHAAGTPITQVNGGILGLDPTLPFGVRTVDGRFNNVLPGQTSFGAADTLFPRLVPPTFGPGTGGDPDGPGPAPVVPASHYNQTSGVVFDPQPRIASNLIVDQSVNNPAAIAAALEAAGSADIAADLATVIAARDALPAVPTAAEQAAFELLLSGLGLVLENGSLVIPNLAPDGGLSAPFNSWMTLFGQFFDHGLDLATKGGNGSVLIPLMPDDPLFNPLSQTNFLVVTRLTQFGPGHEAQNTTTSFVDQNQTYTSVSSHQVFLRAYATGTDGKTVATGELLDGAGGGLPTWAEVKANARTFLGINLTDDDVGNVPLLLTDEYGRFIPDAATGFAQLVIGTNPNGTPVLASGTALNPVSTHDIGGNPAVNALRTGHAFLDDIAHNAVRGTTFTATGAILRPGVAADGDTLADTGSTGNAVPVGPDGRNTQYDNELLDRHFITGDGRGNENIGLTTVHHVFHQEHNRLVEHTKQTILDTGDLAFIAQWQLPDGSWNGERLFQAARFGTEMQYQHLVFEEFARKVSPTVNVFAGYDQAIDPSIVAEFAHVVYRFGHSMLNENVDLINAAGQASEVGLIEAFLNPVMFDTLGVDHDAAAGEVIRGMTRQTGNEIDEFVTGALRNNLLGLPLDLATINMIRAREQGAPSLNEARREFFAGTAASSATGIGDAQLKPYESWTEFAAHLKTPMSVINFIAAYGTHQTILAATTLEGKRDAAGALVLGIAVGTAAAPDPVDRLDFLNSTGTWASTAGPRANATWDDITVTGLDDVDLWLGGLAEAQMPFGGMLGSTFNFVFETQMERLQDGDRFYYLTRTAGLNFKTELEGNSFAALIERNTDLGADGMHLPGDIFSVPGYILEVVQSRQIDVDPVHALTGNAQIDALNLLNPLVSRNNPATPGVDTNYLKYSGVEHVVLGGSAANDILISSEGDDTLWGDGGNDRLQGGAGNDFLIGGDGDDILTDTFGDDNFKGGAGNDAIHTGAGVFDLVLAGDGNDFIVGAADVTETFAGSGNDFVYAGPGADTVFGGDGDDWIEGGDQADLLQGDNGAPFQDSTLIGNDVIIGQGGNDDYDSESGDDIMVAGPGVSRFEGMLGFDWVTYERDSLAANADLFLTGLLPVNIEANRDRFDLTEGLSGGSLNDVLRGNDADTVALTAVDAVSGQNNAINNAAQIALINGFQALLGAGVTSFSGGNILLGGGGQDFIEGRGGNDLIDGDAMLNVRIAGVDIGGTPFSADSMAEIQARVFAGEIRPGDIRIVREIIDGDLTNASDDIAAFSGSVDDYVVTTAGGRTTVRHVVANAAGPDGTDTVINVERLQFSDGLFALGANGIDPNDNINRNPDAVNDVNLGIARANAPVVLNLLANDTDLDGQPLRISAINGADVLANPAGVAVSGGTVTVENGVATFRPTLNLTGTRSFTYTVSDGAGGVDTATATLNIASQVDRIPVLTIGTTPADPAIPVVAATAENATPILVDFNATDANLNDVLRFTIAPVNNTTNADGALFAINEFDGTLRFIGPPDFEAPGDSAAAPNTANNVYNVVVRVTDAIGLYDEQAVTVTVTDADDAPTAVSVTGAVAVRENTAVRTKIADIVVTDPDTNPLFLVNPVTVSDARFEAVGTELFLKAGQTQQSLNFEAQPGGLIPLTLTVGTVSAAVNVTLTDAPAFEAAVHGTSAFGSSAAAGSWLDDNLYPRVLADVNGDGRADIVGFGDDATHVALSNGDGTFAEQKVGVDSFGSSAIGGEWLTNDRYHRTAGDVTGDGKADIVGFGDDGVWIATAKDDASGTFNSPALTLNSFGFSTLGGEWLTDNDYHRELADVNNDGLADIVGFGDDGVWIALATVTGGTGTATDPFRGDGHFESPALAKDQDGATLNEFGLSALGGGWTSQTAMPRHVADVNGDGRADIVGFRDNDVWVSLASATIDGAFARAMAVSPQLFTTGNGPWASDDLSPRQLADVNGDGMADIIGFHGPSGAYVALATGGGQFGPLPLEPASFGPSAADWASNNLNPRTFADVTGDGRADIVSFADTGAFVSQANDFFLF